MLAGWAGWLANGLGWQVGWLAQLLQVIVNKTFVQSGHYARTIILWRDPATNYAIELFWGAAVGTQRGSFHFVTTSLTRLPAVQVKLFGGIVVLPGLRVILFWNCRLANRGADLPENAIDQPN